MASAAAAAASVAVIVVVFGSRVKHRTDSLHGFEQLKHPRSLTLYKVENKRKKQKKKQRKLLGFLCFRNKVELDIYCLCAFFASDFNLCV
jgi:hypothetical protein